MKKLLLLMMVSILTVSSLAIADDVMFTADDVQSILAATHEGDYSMLSDTVKSKIPEYQWNEWTKKRAERADAVVTAKEDKQAQRESNKETKKEEFEVKKETKKEELEQKKQNKKSEFETKKETKKAELETKKEEKKVEIHQKQEERKATKTALQQAVLDGDYEAFTSLAPADMLEKVPTEEVFIKLSEAYNKKMSNTNASSTPKPVAKLPVKSDQSNIADNPAMVERNDNPNATTKRMQTRRGYWINAPVK